MIKNSLKILSLWLSSAPAIAGLSAEEFYIRGDFAQAESAWVSQANVGDPKAQYALGMMKTLWAETEDDLIDGARWYERSAQSGHPMGAYHFALALETGKGVEFDSTRGTEWMAKAAHAGVAQAQYLFGLAYELGVGVPQDLREAVFWMAQATSRGDQLAGAWIAGRQADLPQYHIDNQYPFAHEAPTRQSNAVLALQGGERAYRIGPINEAWMQFYFPQNHTIAFVPSYAAHRISY